MPSRVRIARCVDLLALLGFAGLWLALAADCAGALRGPLGLAALLAAAPLGHLVADLASGIAHWICDTFFDADTPLIGRALIAPFREHHGDPLAITRSGALATNQLHQWAHAPRAPHLARWLQRRRLILSPEHHALHHERGDRAYCITVGWCDRPLDRSGLLPRLEGLVRMSHQPATAAVEDAAPSRPSPAGR